jgi:hypothetical protein
VKYRSTTRGHTITVTETNLVSPRFAVKVGSVAVELHETEEHAISAAKTIERALGLPGILSDRRQTFRIPCGTCGGQGALDEDCFDPSRAYGHYSRSHRCDECDGAGYEEEFDDAGAAFDLIARWLETQEKRTQRSLASDPSQKLEGYLRAIQRCQDFIENAVDEVDV